MIKLVTYLFIAFAGLGFFTRSQAAAATEKYDVVITGGRIVDGSGAPWFVTDVGVKAGKIAAIGRIDEQEAADVIDASGLVVAPGFIDMMGQTATPMLEDPATALNLLTQGVTTINAGEGASEAPLDEEAARRRSWRTMSEYFQILNLKGLPVNVAQTVGLTQIRRIVIGEEDRRPTDDELQTMKELVREAMEAGAIGVSTALIYPPAVYASTQEIASLAKVSGEFGGRYYTHMRNEGDRLLEAIDEAIKIGRTAQTPVHIFHLKAAGTQNWHKMQLALDKITAAREQGEMVTADVYPYQYNGLTLASFIHPRHFVFGREKFLAKLDRREIQAEVRKELETTKGWENWFRHIGGDWNRVVIGSSRSSEYKKFAGRTLAEIAQQLEEDPWDTFFKLAQAGTFVLPKSMSEENIATAMQHEFVSFCTDVGPASRALMVSHPRAYGAFPRLFSHFVREQKTLSLEQAVSQASAVAANEIMAYDRGRISVGLAADLIVFDFEAFQDRATLAQPSELAEGMKHVLVNGVIVLRDGKQTKQRPGRVLRGPGYDASQAPEHLLTGKSAPGLEEIDQFVSSFLAKHGAPGASLAITDQGRLVYARGFGYADVTAKEPVEPSSLFRIASVSKPITAIAIMQLVDAGKLSLEDTVYSILDGYEPYLDEGVEFDERQNDITIRHLLQHRGGWDRNISFDGMFQSVRFANALDTPPPAGHDEIIRCMRGVPLDFAPGKRYAYSNYGYCLLGRVIEKLTGQSYEDYVKQHVLKPIGITDLAIGRTALELRQPNEVRYYDPSVTRSVFADDLNLRVASPYGAWYLESMDSHGAWIASAKDLVRFASAFDDPESCPLLSAEAIQTMFERPDGLASSKQDGSLLKTFYAAGWQIRCDENDQTKYQMHGGSLPGTSTRLVRRADGRNFAILFNARETPLTNRLAGPATEAINRMLDEIEALPNVDYFSE